MLALAVSETTRDDGWRWVGRSAPQPQPPQPPQPPAQQPAGEPLPAELTCALGCKRDDGWRGICRSDDRAAAAAAAAAAANPTGCTLFFPHLQRSLLRFFVTIWIPITPAYDGSVSSRQLGGAEVHHHDLEVRHHVATCVLYGPV